MEWFAGARCRLVVKPMVGLRSAFSSFERCEMPCLYCGLDVF